MVVRTITYLWFRLPVISYRSRVQVDSREVLLGHCAVCPRGGTYLWMASTWVWILLRNLVRRSRWLVNTAGRLYILWCMMIWLPSRASGVVRWGPYDFWMIYMYLLLEPWSSGLSDWILCLGLERRITQWCEHRCRCWLPISWFRGMDVSEISDSEILTWFGHWVWHES